MKIKENKKSLGKMISPPKRKRQQEKGANVSKKIKLTKLEANTTQDKDLPQIGLKMNKKKNQMKMEANTNEKKSLKKKRVNVKKKKKFTAATAEPSEKKKLKEMSVDDMFAMIQNDDHELSEEEEEPKKDEQKVKKKRKTKVKKMQKQEKEKDDDAQKGDNAEMEDDDEEDLTNVGNLSQKEYLQKLKSTDPDFYAAMMESSDVMDMLSSGDENEETNDAANMNGEADDDVAEESSDEDEGRGGAVFQPPTSLEEFSDESDNEGDNLEERGRNVITSSMLTKWESAIMDTALPVDTFLDVQEAFAAAIKSLGSKGKDQAEVISKYKVEEPEMFNAVIRLCLRSVPVALPKILKLKTLKDDPTKSKRWGKMKNYIKRYLRNLISLIECVAEPRIAEVVLKRGIIPVLGYYSGHPSTHRQLLKQLIKLWSTSEKRVRVVSFIAIFRLSKTLPSDIIEWLLKKLYLTYVQNCRFTSPSTWGMIDFMRMSLVELFALDHGLAYKLAFIYIRQMAVHLRNAYVGQKEEKMQMVYNWQYVHCLHLWSDLLGHTHPSQVLQPLIYPLTQIAIGTIKLQESPAFYPLVFQISGILTDLSRLSKTFIPLLPFYLEILSRAQLDKMHKKVSMKPFDWLCMLRLSQDELTQSAYKDGVVDQVYNGIVNYLDVESHSIGFPELVVPAILQLKSFLKKCKAPNYTKKIKQLLDKIKENSAFIEKKRKDVTFGIDDSKAISNWEIAVRQEGTPFATYSANWRKIHMKDQMKRISNRAEIDDYNLPTIKKHELMEKQKAKDKDDFKELFASDEEEDMDDDTRFLSKRERSKLSKHKAESDDSDDGENEDDDNDNNLEPEDDEGAEEPPLKKEKIEVNDNDNEEEEEEDSSDMDSFDDNKERDVVREINFSDLEEDEIDE